MAIIFEYDAKPLFKAFPAFRLIPQTVAQAITALMECAVSEGTDPQKLLDYLQTKTGIIRLADLVFDWFDPGRASG